VALEVIFHLAGRSSFKTHISISDLYNTLTAQDVDKLSKRCNMLELLLIFVCSASCSLITKRIERERANFAVSKFAILALAVKAGTYYCAHAHNTPNTGAPAVKAGTYYCAHAHNTPNTGAPAVKAQQC